MHTRLSELEAHHHKRLGQLTDLMTSAKTGVQLAEGLFARAMAEGQTVLATAETLAHAHYLVSKGRARRHVGAGGQITFERA